MAIPVSDVDRVASFYADRVGFVVDHDHQVDDDLPLRAAHAASRAAPAP